MLGNGRQIYETIWEISYSKHFLEWLWIIGPQARHVLCGKRVGLINFWDLFQLLTFWHFLSSSKGKSHILLVSTFRLNISAWICRSINAMLSSKVAFEKPAFPTFLNLSTAAQAEESSGMSSFFTDEGLSEKWCLPKHSFADCLHPLQGSSEGSKNLGGLRQWWVNESFLPILEVILNKAILLWEVERNLMVPVCLGSLCPEDAHIQRVAESYFSRPSLTCLCHNTVGSCKGKSHRPQPVRTALCFQRYHP